MAERILDQQLEKEIRDAVNRQVEEVRKKQAGFEHSVSEHPYKWVFGAFIGGLLLGKIMSK